MGTWNGVIVDTKGRPDFWEVAQPHGVAPTSESVPNHVLITCEVGMKLWEAPIQLAEKLSSDLATTCIGFVIQTVSDAHETVVFREGSRVRRLEYAGDEGWMCNEGESQPWEAAYFFDDASTSEESSAWPDMLWDEISDEDIARYEAAKRAGDPSTVIDLMHPSSVWPMSRVCSFFGIDPDKPSGRWSKKKKAGFFSRIFGGAGG